MIIPPEWKPTIFKASLAAYGFGRLIEWVAKTYFPEIKVESPKKPAIPGAPLAILALFVVLGASGCRKPIFTPELRFRQSPVELNDRR